MVGYGLPTNAAGNLIAAKESVSGIQVGTANTQLQFTITTSGISMLSFIFQASGGVGVFASQSCVIAVSQDNATFINADALNLGTAATFVKQYNETTTGATAAIVPQLFPYVRVTVPALGSSVVGTVTYSGK